MAWHRRGEMVAPTYDIERALMSYGRVSKSSVWDRCTVAMSYGRDVKSYAWDSHRPCHTDELVSPTYEVVVVKSYGWDVKSFLWDIDTLLCHTDEMLSPMYEIDVLLLCHADEMLNPTYEIATALCHTDELISPPYEIAIVTISYERVTKSSVWDSMLLKKIYKVVLLHRRTISHMQTR